MPNLPVSIVIPLYNKEKYIERSIRSVLRQTHELFELIIIDDGSTDRSVSIVDSFHDSRIRLVRQSNMGVSAARNRGVNESRYEWIAFLDADDEWDEHFLAETASVCKEHGDLSVVATNFTMGSDDGVGVCTNPRDGMVHNYFKCWYERTAVMHVSCVLVNREKLRQVGLFPRGVSVGEDMDTWARLAWSGGVWYIPRVLARYHVDVPGNTANSPYPIGWNYPCVAGTFRKWRAAGMIPEEMLFHSVEYVADQVVCYARRVLHANGRRWFALLVIARYARLCGSRGDDFLAVFSTCLPTQGRGWPFSSIVSWFGSFLLRK